MSLLACALLFSILPAASQQPSINSQGETCPCRETPHQRDGETCSRDQSPQHPFGVDHLIGVVYSFDSGGPLLCDYLFLDWLIPAEQTAGLFPESQSACTIPWAENADNGILYDSSVTISHDGRYVIPYCYGMTSVTAYEINRRLWGTTSIKQLAFPAGVEAVRFFPNHLVAIDRNSIHVFSMSRGRQFTPTSSWAFPHSLYYPSVIFQDLTSPIWMRNMVMDGDYLYLLNAPGNDYGPFLTFKIAGGQLVLIDDGRRFISADDTYPFIFRNNLQLFSAHGKKYLAYHQDACRDRWGPGYMVMLRLNNNIPETFIYPPDGGAACWIWDKVFKNEYYSGFRSDAPGFCNAGVSYLNENEQYVDAGDRVDHNPIFKIGSYQGPDTELWSNFGRSIGCSTDDLPVVEHMIFPTGPVYGNFLVMGRASDSEGIRRVFAGDPVCGNYLRAPTFDQLDGSVIFQTVIQASYDPMCNPNAVYPFFQCPIEDNSYIAIAEDFDGDSNQSPDAPWDQDMHCLRFKPQPDPMPEGEVETQPCADAVTLSFSGWAVDNSGIRQGWLLSEDAQVLAPLTVGLPRPDIGARYPDLPGSSNAGFSVSYDLSALPEGQYEFTVRILAHDYQVLDFGPYTIYKDASHPRPLSPPDGRALLGPDHPEVHPLPGDY